MAILFLTDSAHDDEFHDFFEKSFSDQELYGRCNRTNLREILDGGHEVVIVDARYMVNDRWDILSRAMRHITDQNYDCTFIIYAREKRLIPSHIDTYYLHVVAENAVGDSLLADALDGVLRGEEALCA